MLRLVELADQEEAACPETLLARARSNAEMAWQLSHMRSQRCAAEAQRALARCCAGGPKARCVAGPRGQADGLLLEEVKRAQGAEEAKKLSEEV